MKGDILEIKKLGFKYPSYENFATTDILEDISASIYPGSINVILGRPESGKSTLAHILSALIPAHSGGDIKGCVFFGETDILESEASEIIEKCGIVFQDPEKQTVTTDCFSEVAFSLESLGVEADDIELRVKKIFCDLGIENLLKKKTTEISGGEKKKVALAGLMAVNPDLWLLDDLMEELDNPSKIKIFKLVRDSNKTIIFFTSKFHDVFSKADNFFLLSDGRLSSSEQYPFSSFFKKRLELEGILADDGIIKNEKIFLNIKNAKELLSVNNLEYFYKKDDFKLSVEKFSINEGEIISIVGRNGSGKSTFAELLCGLLEAKSGEIIIEGTQANCLKLNSFCAYMFQNPDYQIFLPTVFDELSWSMRFSDYSSNVVKTLVDSVIEEFSLPEPFSPPSMMSYSSRKRLQAAVYYLLKRPVFILDEADVSLSYLDFIDLVKRLKAVSKCLIIITHNLWLASVVSSRVIGIENGELIDRTDFFEMKNLESWLSGTHNDC